MMPSFFLHCRSSMLYHYNIVAFTLLAAAFTKAPLLIDAPLYLLFTLFLEEWSVIDAPYYSFRYGYLHVHTLSPPSFLHIVGIDGAMFGIIAYTRHCLLIRHFHWHYITLLSHTPLHFRHRSEILAGSYANGSRTIDGFMDGIEPPEPLLVTASFICLLPRQQSATLVTTAIASFLSSMSSLRRLFINIPNEHTPL
jgi:hypothetical protein